MPPSTILYTDATGSSTNLGNAKHSLTRFERLRSRMLVKLLVKSVDDLFMSRTLSIAKAKFDSVSVSPITARDLLRRGASRNSLSLRTSL